MRIPCRTPSKVLSRVSNSTVSAVSWLMDFCSVDRNFTLSLASSRASSTSRCSLAKGTVYVLLFASKNFRIFFRLSIPSWEWIEFKLLALLFQNWISAAGSGCLPSRNIISGSCLRMWRICFVHVMTAPSRTWTRSLQAASSATLLPACALPPEGKDSLGGWGSKVCPLVKPHVTCTCARNTWYLPMTSFLMRSDQPRWLEGFINVDM
mmetsp:Transcript_90029/g.275602  ORF Transcript_90029/g.275602 Transcript_90029/m.275602 type:complete len:208 (-) Transcript_90029:494-1117(-)